MCYGVLNVSISREVVEIEFRLDTVNKWDSVLQLHNTQDAVTTKKNNKSETNSADSKPKIINISYQFHQHMTLTQLVTRTIINPVLTEIICHNVAGTPISRQKQFTIWELTQSKQNIVTDTTDP